MRFALAALFTLATLQAADSKDVDKTVAISPNGTVTIETHKGSIKVTTWDQAQVEIHARIQAEPGTDVTRRRFDQTEVAITSFADSVRIETVTPDSCCNYEEGSNPEVLYTIRMPRNAKLNIHNHRTDTQVSGLAGALEIETHRGPIHIEHQGGPVRLTTYRGDTQVSWDASPAGSSIETSRGNIDLLVPRSSRFDVDADMGRRAIFESDFAVNVRSAGNSEGRIHGSVNGGGPAIQINSDRGIIHLRGN